MKNPFKPTAGANPPFVIGRDHHLDSFKEGIENGPGAPGLLSLIIGARGIGKTVLLNEAERYASCQNWIVISETATDESLLVDVERSIVKHLQEMGNGPIPKMKLNHVQGGLISVGWDNYKEAPESLKDLASELATILQGRNAGLLIAIDEIQAIEQKQLAKISALAQHLIRKNMPIALIMAGVPSGIDALLKDKASTFLRRADLIELQPVTISEVKDAYDYTFAHTGIFIKENQLLAAATATEGYPFLVQLVGYHLWQLASKTHVVSDENLQQAISIAKMRMNSLVLKTAFHDTKGIGREILLKMAENDGPTKTSDLAINLNKSTKYIGVYRHRLITSGLIVEAGWGQVTFALPYMREYLRGHSISTYVSKIATSTH